ncbi:pfs and NB-ARC domain-containing protein [Pyricularia oryzae Y34]|uniref:Pfs and NB-ARC domain-containing protein n=2 Tax=Pyricularia oryzae TaxID=318829 RepID=A0AA97NLH7_PYRO3|nr:pfs and NB-ARC domain-containing protein [Pyricularia oryzae Y34]
MKQAIEPTKSGTRLHGCMDEECVAIEGKTLYNSGSFSIDKATPDTWGRSIVNGGRPTTGPRVRGHGQGRDGEPDGLMSSYTALRLVVLAGICAGVPSQEKENDILLGDVVISETVIQYDFGRQYPGEFSTKVSIADGLGRADASIRTQVEAFESDHERDRLINRAANVLTEIHDKGKKKRRPVDYSCPHPSTDLLFEFSYLHRHQRSSDCGCSTTQACNVAVATACEELNCGASYFVHRPRLERLVSNQDDAAFAELEIFVGCIGSGDTVMKSGERRDKMAKKHGIIAFEIEGAGAGWPQRRLDR